MFPSCFVVVYFKIPYVMKMNAKILNACLFQINNFFKQILRQLLDLNLPRYTIKKRLRPAMDFLSRELRRFHGVLYSDSFNKLLADLWSEVVEVSTLSSLNFRLSDSSLSESSVVPRVRCSKSTGRLEISCWRLLFGGQALVVSG